MPSKSHRTPRKHVKFQFRIYLGDEIALGPGKAELLRHISETGSISEAARCMEMSYNRAWLLVRTMNRCFKKTLVEVRRGGDSRGGAQLSSTGKYVLGLYEQLETKLLKVTCRPTAAILATLKN
jgi:molybdate transport system regulatory protein